MNCIKLYDKIKHGMKGLFFDKIVSVELPYGNVKSLTPVSGWTLVVNYETKGRKTYYFAEDDERYIVTYGSARQAAYDTYNLYRQSMQRQQKFAKMFSRQK